MKIQHRVNRCKKINFTHYTNDSQRRVVILFSTDVTFYNGEQCVKRNSASYARGTCCTARPFTSITVV